MTSFPITLCGQLFFVACEHMRGPCRRGRSIMATYVDILKSEFPEIDTEVFDYITGECFRLVKKDLVIIWIINIYARTVASISLMSHRRGPVLA